MRDFTLGIRLDPEEKATVERAARQSDHDVVDWCRRALLRVAKVQIARKRRKKGGEK